MQSILNPSMKKASASPLQDTTNAQGSNTTLRKLTKKAHPQVEIPKDLLQKFIKYGNGMELHNISPKDAKQYYFLTPADLRFTDYEAIGGGIGCGPPMKFYQHKDLIAVALEKHGRDGLQKKLEARYKREQKKREREEKAEQILEQQLKKQKTGRPVKDSPDIKKLRASLLRAAKKKMGFEYSGSPKRWRIEVPGSSKVAFAALLGRPDDKELSTFVKRGAYYTEENVCAMQFFGVDEDKLVKAFKREGVSQQIYSGIVVRFKPSTNELSVNGSAEMCGW